MAKEFDWDSLKGKSEEKASSDTFDYDAAARGEPTGDTEVVGGKERGFFDQLSVWGASSPEEKKRMFAKQIFPDMPVEESIQRFKQTKEGVDYYEGKDGKNYRLYPESWYDPRNLGTVVGEAAAPTVGALKGAAVGAPLGPVGAIGGAIIGGTMGEYGRQAAGDLWSPEASTYDQQGFNTTRALVEGAASGLGEGIGQGLTRFASRNADTALTPAAREAGEEVIEQGRNMGLTVTPGEATGSAKAIGQQKVVAGSPAAAQQMGDFAVDRNMEVLRSFDDVADAATGRGASDVVDASDDLVNVGRAVEKQAKDVAQGRAAPYYAKADRSSAVVEVKDLDDTLSDLSRVAKGKGQKAVEGIRRLLYRKTTEAEKRAFSDAAKASGKDAATVPGEVLDTSVRGLDQSKKELDRLLGLKAGEKGSLSGYPRQVAADLRKELIERMRVADPDYAKALDTYAKAQDELVKPIQEALEPILKGKSKEAQANVARKLLDPAARTPAQVQKARKAILEHPQGKEVWDRVTRNIFQEVGDTASKIGQKGEVVNPAGKIAQALHPKGKLYKNLKAALGGDTQALDDAVKVYRAIARSVDSNSDTAFKGLGIEELKNQSQNTLSWLTDFAKPGQWFRGWDATNYDKHVTKLAEIIMSGEKGAIQKLAVTAAQSPRKQAVRSAVGQTAVRPVAPATDNFRSEDKNALMGKR